MTHSLKHLFMCTTIALLAACGSQESANFDKNIDNNMPVADVNIASTAPNNIANNTTNTPEKEQAAPESKLLSSLAASYPGGQLPADRAAQATKDLAQNPAALKQTAPIQAQSTPIQAQSGSIQSQSGLIQPQAFAVPRVTSTDYLPVQRIQNTTLYGAYFFSIYAGEVTSALAGNPNWRLEGPAFWASLVTAPELNPVHRFQNKQNGSYLYTIYDGERANIVANYSATFTYEGIAWYARQTAATGWSALYRFRNKTNGTYLFSAYESEKNAIVANYPAIFELEGIAYYVRQDAPSAAVVNPIAALDNHTCAIMIDATVSCWGSNVEGQLGDGTKIDKIIPTSVLGLTGVVSLAVGSFSTCALKSDGTVSCWGYNVGDGTEVSKTSPTAVPSLSGVVSIVASYVHTCALKSDGTVSCWGSNGFGQLGDGSTTDRFSPTNVPGLAGVKSIAVNRYNTCAVKSNGTVDCWGWNIVGRLGDGTTTDRFSPTPVLNLTGVVSVAVGYVHTCALKSNGKVNCWGSNFSGQLGDTTTTDRSIPGADLSLINVASLSAGEDHTCALGVEGKIRCWGSNADGQVAPSSAATRLTAPVPVFGLPGAVTSVIAAARYTCALISNGAISCWGYNNQGQLGNGTTTARTSSDPITLSSPTPVLGGAVYWK